MRPKVQYMRLAIPFALLALAFACGSTERVEDSPTPPAQAQAPAPRPQTPTPPAPTAQPRPAPDRAATVEPSGTLTIAVAAVGSPSGLPRFCAAGCSENIYMSGATETLFGSKASEGGAVIADPMLALDFVLSPTLEFGDFTLRQGVQFHHGFGEMSADDVAFSYNDANSVTNPESIHGQAGDFAPLIESIEAIEPHKVRLNYRSYDSRGVLHRFSMFWQTAGIVSKSVYDVKGADAMRNDYTGVGPFVIDRWTPGDGIFMTAFTDYYGAPLGLGPHVERVEWRVAGESVARRAMLESGPAQNRAGSRQRLRRSRSRRFRASEGRAFRHHQQHLVRGQLLGIPQRAYGRSPRPRARHQQTVDRKPVRERPRLRRDHRFYGALPQGARGSGLVHRAPVAGRRPDGRLGSRQPPALPVDSKPPTTCRSGAGVRTSTEQES